MLDILPPAHLLWPFWVAGLALNLTPGADMAIAVTSGARGGYLAGLAAALGTFTGSLGHILMAVLGLSALLAAYPAVFSLLKWLGVAYLIFIAFQLLRPATSANSRNDANTAIFSIPDTGSQAVLITPKQAYRQALLINLLNPKVGLFFLAFLPQFVEPELANPWLQILALGLVFNVTGTILNSIFGLLGAAGAQRLSGQALYSRLARYGAACILLILAVRLALLSVQG